MLGSEMSQTSSCAMPGCSRPSWCAGLCHSHYKRQREARLLAEGRTCAVDGCVAAAIAGGYCDMHYARVRTRGAPGPSGRLIAPPGQTTCKVDGCNQPHSARGYCSNHYVLYQAKTCTIDGCREPLLANGYCQRHYQASRRGHGQRDRAIDERCSCDLCAQYRAEHPDEWQRAQHIFHELGRRQRRRLERFPPWKRALITRQLRDGATLAEATQAAGITVQALWSYTDLLPDWGRRLDAVLMEVRDPDIRHGTEYAYKRHGCRCPECRQAKNRYR